jgi:hypothetical protein
MTTDTPPPTTPDWSADELAARTKTADRYVLDAGFSSTTVLDIEHNQFRIDRLNT